MEKVEHNAGKMETQLKLWGAKLDELAAKTVEADTEAKLVYHKRIADLKAKVQVAQGKLDDFKAGDREKWETFKTGVGTAWHELEAAFKELAN